MEFLCPNHRQQFADLPLDERRDLWLFWMEYAYAYSQQGQWPAVISLSGSAFDLACLHGNREESCMHIELTLAAILVSRVLSDRGDLAGTERVTERALASLKEAYGSEMLDGCCGLSECVDVLMDSSRQASFFADYLNWPSLPFGRVFIPISRTMH